MATLSHPFTFADFDEKFPDFEPELRDQAIEIANQLQRERPDASREEIAGLALQRARHWWLDRAG
ncbi:hypothetical protein CLV84_2230 [Neolewinella xylanilytica]|uniref:Uncharacterized protein n=1 Tax=Neolewinella xylanilytica TaxID=1514080 RepID=A0A2S6I2D6_9BACT|nr:hypothetical protein [Neolewinella xylanilytica]PPK85335.1 hypothetical protein CLV84_2230 [Neolewinella xylanilytica]